MWCQLCSFCFGCALCVHVQALYCHCVAQQKWLLLWWVVITACPHQEKVTSGQCLSLWQQNIKPQQLAASEHTTGQGVRGLEPLTPELKLLHVSVAALVLWSDDIGQYDHYVTFWATCTVTINVTMCRIRWLYYQLGVLLSQGRVCKNGYGLYW